MKAEWKHAPEFHEVASALGIKTTQVFAVTASKPFIALYSPDLEDPSRIFKVALRRDRYKILRMNGVPEEQVGFIDNMQGEIKRRMEDLDDD
jgi:hypothetical protein